MKVLKGYVYRLYPNKEQAVLIDKTTGCSRFIYNYFLNDRINYYKTKKSKTAFDQNKVISEIKKEYNWLE